MKSHTAEQGDTVAAVPDLVAAAEQALPQQAHALARARAFAEPLIAGETLETGENTLAHADAVAAATLLPSTRSWYMGDNIPGKPRRILIYLGGFGAYRDACENGAANGFQKFRLARAPAVSAAA